MTESGNALVLFRYIWQGRVRGAYPTALVERTSSRIVLVKPEGSPYIRPGPAPNSSKLDGSWDVIERVADWHSMIVYDFGAWYSTWLMWDSSGVFGGWYVDFHVPWRESELGYDTTSLAVDIAVDTGGDWSWKDREELDDLVDRGVVADTDRAMALRESERAIDDIENRRGIFSDEWTSVDQSRLRSLAPLAMPSGWSEVN
jgi:predicted RNA-binding protein associated with RNAse of E/G family